MRLIVIPVRGGSVGIPRKALTPLGGVPPIVRTVQTAKALAPVIVITDDVEVGMLADQHGARVEWEAPTDGARTLDRSVWRAVEQAGNLWGTRELIATVQCTSPLLRAETIQRCFHLVEHGACDTALTVRDDRHVAWTGPLDQSTLLTPWAVRQSLPPRWVLTGGCVVSRRELMHADQRFGGRIQLVEVEGPEAVDLDAPADWAVAEWYADAPTLRETLMARVLGEVPQWRGVVVQLSAWGESPEEWSYRSGIPTVEGRVLKVRGQHTAHEAQIALGALGPDEQDVTIVTSAYHQLRAFLTFVKALERRGLDRTVRLWNAPAPSRMDKLTDEWHKMRAYPDVARLEDGLRYLDWRDALVAVP